MLQSLDVNTCSNYGTGLLRFTQFCDQTSVPESAHMPASTELLSLFSTHHTSQLSEKMLNNWLTGLHFWHIVNGASWNGNDMLHHIQRGFSKLVPTSSKRAKCPPVTLDALCTLHDWLNLTDTFDAAIWALAAIAFWSCCQLGELLVPSAHSFDSSKHAPHSILPLSISSLENGTQYSSFHIPCASLPSQAPLFTFHATSHWSLMTCTWFLQRCNQVWVSAGFPNMPGHAFCIGGATKLLLQGVPPDIVATQGCWKSQAFLDYWHQINSILP
ncbi:hypothetical protein EDD16DRAFT_1695074 [Pisolithus croceorrhizus]|nr:hypothetical protein EDD16DRAFT_1695074 [Pisolithus croceorrhizus]